MKIDLTTLLNGRVSSIDFSYDFDVSKTDSPVTLPEEIKITESVKVEGCVTDKNNCMFLNAEITVKYTTLCDRCLDEIRGVLSFEYERMVSTEAPRTDEDSEEEIIYVNESGIDIDSSLIEDIVLELPLYHLCREDCPGLCQKCGKKLVEGSCDCDSKKEIDPRLKILQKLLDNYY